METTNLNIEEKINVFYLKEECENCNNKLEIVEVNMLHEEITENRWQKEKVYYCKNCKTYYISIFKQKEFLSKYPGYIYPDNDGDNIKRISDLTCYSMGEKKKHTVCNGISKKQEFILEKVILENKMGQHTRFTMKKCEVCNNYFATTTELAKIKTCVKKLTVYPIKEIESKISKKHQILYVNDIPTELDANSILNIVTIDKCTLEKHKLTKMMISVGFKVANKTRIMKKMVGQYCKDCEMYIVSKKEYDDKADGKEPECNLYIDGNQKYKYESASYEETKQNKYKTKNTKNKVDFFVRTNIINCAREGHKIEDIIAEIDVIDNNGEISSKAINAYYCSDCNLYFIYNRDYEKLRKKYIPLCSIYEYKKWIEGYNSGIKLNQESLLHSFGYNVGEKEGLTEKQRRKILLFIIENGLINKHEIISLLNLFIDMRKSNPSQMNAIKKWKSDISYLREIDTTIKKIVKVNSIRIVRLQTNKR